MAAYLGGWLFLCVCALAAGVIFWEWTSLVVRGTDPRILAPGVAALLVALALTGERQIGAAVGMIAIGALLAGGIVAAWPRPYPASNPAVWGAGGVVYAGRRRCSVPLSCAATRNWGLRRCFSYSHSFGQLTFLPIWSAALSAVLCSVPI